MLTTFAFIAAQLLLGIVVTLGVKLARREPNLQARFEAVIEITHRATRLDAARRETKEESWSRH